MSAVQIHKAEGTLVTYSSGLREHSAKVLFIGSNPIVTSKILHLFYGRALSRHVIPRLMWIGTRLADEDLCSAAMSEGVRACTGFEVSHSAARFLEPKRKPPFRYGGRSSVGRASGCGPECRAFDPRRSPQILWWGATTIGDVSIPHSAIVMNVALCLGSLSGLSDGLKNRRMLVRHQSQAPLKI